VATIISALQTTVTADAAVSCTNETTKIICTANTAGTAFTYSSNTVIPPLTFTSNNTQTKEIDSKDLFGVFLFSIAYGGFNFDGVGFCVAFMISVEAVEI
jgi:hypothetical protein